MLSIEIPRNSAEFRLSARNPQELMEEGKDLRWEVVVLGTWCHWWGVVLGTRRHSVVYVGGWLCWALIAVGGAGRLVSLVGGLVPFMDGVLSWLHHRHVLVSSSRR